MFNFSIRFFIVFVMFLSINVNAASSKVFIVKGLELSKCKNSVINTQAKYKFDALYGNGYGDRYSLNSDFLNVGGTNSEGYSYHVSCTLLHEKKAKGHTLVVIVINGSNKNKVKEIYNYMNSRLIRGK